MKFDVLKPAYRLIQNRLYILTEKGQYKRIRQKLPESITSVTELEEYDYEYSKLPPPNCKKLFDDDKYKT